MTDSLVSVGHMKTPGFLDFSKAVPHSILLDKVSNCEVSKFTVCWVKNWMNGRAQKVVVNGGYICLVTKHQWCF